MKSIKEVERDMIIQALRQTEGNKNRAAKVLGIGRATIYRKMKLYSLDWNMIKRGIKVGND